MKFRIDSQPAELRITSSQVGTKLETDVIGLAVLIEQSEKRLAIKRPAIAMQVLQELASYLERTYQIPASIDAAYSCYLQITRLADYLAAELRERIAVALTKKSDRWRLVVNGRLLDVSTFELNGAISKLETAHKVIDKGWRQPTIEFLNAVTEYLASFKIKSDATTSWSVWEFINQLLGHHSNFGHEESQIARFYGIDPFALKETEQLVLMANIPRLEAQTRIERGRFDASNPKQVYELFMAAYNDESLASDMRLESMKRLIDERTGARDGTVYV